MQDKQVCNLCGKELDFFDRQENFTIHTRIGYGSIHDGDKVHLQFCCDCFDKVVAMCTVSPIEEVSREWIEQNFRDTLITPCKKQSV